VREPLYNKNLKSFQKNVVMKIKKLRNKVFQLSHVALGTTCPDLPKVQLDTWLIWLALLHQEMRYGYGIHLVTVPRK
jgi:hypothetical protein